jgi:hypothetical protein
LSTNSPLDAWKFLIGRWKGTAQPEFGEEGVVDSTHVFAAELGDKFITGRHEAWSGKRLIHKAASFLYYDPRTDKFRRKEVYSYGFVNNEVEEARTDTEIRFAVTSEPSPKQFDDIRWRSYIRKLAENKIALGLEMAKGKGDFASYGETIAIKQQ